MNTPSFEWLAGDAVRGIAALIGILSIFLGYRLFCNLAGHSGKRAILLTNMAAGALLASFGIGVLVADFRGFGASAGPSRPEWQRNSSQQGTFTPEKPNPAVRRQEVFV